MQARPGGPPRAERRAGLGVAGAMLGFVLLSHVGHWLALAPG